MKGKKMSFREREGREKRDHRSSYIGIRNGFGKGWGRKLSLKILSLAGATSYRGTKGWRRVEGCRRWGGGGQCILSGDIFTEWEHELAANGMNV